MDLNQQFRRNVRTFYAWVGSMVILGVGPIMAGRLIDRGTTTWRAAGVIVGVASALPWLWTVAVIIRRGDEFVRRMHLIAIALASAFGMLMLLTVGWLVRAGFVDAPDFTVVWLGWLVAWLVALVGTKRYFERPQ